MESRLVYSIQGDLVAPAMRFRGSFDNDNWLQTQNLLAKG